MDQVKIGKQLQELRKSRGWRQSEVSDRIGLSRPAISNIESGKRSLTLATLKRFCEIYSIDISYFQIETANFNEEQDLLTRLDKLFMADLIPEENKDQFFREIMRIYLKSKS